MMQSKKSKPRKDTFLIKKELKSLMRSRWLILGFIISPMFAWLFQGAFLSFIVGETVQLKSKIYFTLEDDGEIGASLFRNITENQDSLRISKMINITTEEGQQLIENRSLTAWIIIPSNFTSTYENYTGSGHPVGWVDFYVNTGIVRATSVASTIRNYINNQLDNYTWNTEVRIHWNTISPEATYGHQLAIFLVMLTSVLAPAPYISQSFAGEREKHTLEALLVVPMSRIRILVSKLIAGLILTSIYIFFTVIGIIVYNASIMVRDIGIPNVPIDYTAYYTVNLDTLPLIMFCQFLVLLCAIGIGIVISCLAKDQATAESVNNLILLVPTMVIGILGFTGSINQFGGLFGLFVQLIPFSHAIIILEGVLSGSATFFGLLGDITYLLGFTLVFLIIGARLFEREAIIS